MKAKLPRGLTKFKAKGEGSKGAHAIAALAEHAAQHGDVKKAKLKVRFNKGDGVLKDQ